MGPDHTVGWEEELHILLGPGAGHHTVGLVEALHILQSPEEGRHIAGWVVELHIRLGPGVEHHIVGLVGALHILLDLHIQVVGRDSALHIGPAMGAVEHIQHKDWIAVEQARVLPYWDLRLVVDRRRVELPRDQQIGQRRLVVVVVLHTRIDLEEGHHIQTAAEAVVLRILLGPVVEEAHQILGPVVEAHQILGLVVEASQIPDLQEYLPGIRQVEKQVDHRIYCSNRQGGLQLEHQKDCSYQLEGLQAGPMEGLLEHQMDYSNPVKVGGLHKMASNYQTDWDQNRRSLQVLEN